MYLLRRCSVYENHTSGLLGIECVCDPVMGIRKTCSHECMQAGVHSFMYVSAHECVIVHNHLFAHLICPQHIHTGSYLFVEWPKIGRQLSLIRPSRLQVSAAGKASRAGRFGRWWQGMRGWRMLAKQVYASRVGTCCQDNR